MLFDSRSLVLPIAEMPMSQLGLSMQIPRPAAELGDPIPLGLPSSRMRPVSSGFRAII